MNSIIADNTVQALRSYLVNSLSAILNQREAQNVVAELFATYMNWTRSELVINAKQRLSESEILKFHFALKKILSGEPLQYVLGHSWFFGRKFSVNSGVLIPRPETEELVRLVIAKNKLSAPHILDVGTGSGCIAITLKQEINASHVTALDISTEALETAKQNANDLQADVSFLTLDILVEFPKKNDFDIIVSNPPYVLEFDKEAMRSSVLLHEPHGALFVPDDDALLFYKRLILLAKNNTGKTCFVACEIHESKKSDLQHLMESSGMAFYEFQKDMQDKDRLLFFQI